MPTLTLEDDTTITGGKLTIGDHDRLDERGSGNAGATLDDVDVVNHGTIQVDKVLAATLKLDGGTTITGGDLSIGSGKLEIGTDGSSAGATLDGVAVTNGNAIVIDDTVGSGASTSRRGRRGHTTITGGTLRVGVGGRNSPSKTAKAPFSTASP